MKKIWLLAFGALTFAACQESLEDRCAREAEAYTKKNCPFKIDQFTTLDSLVFERQTHTLHYYNKLTGTADNAQIDSTEARRLLQEVIKNATSLKIYKDAKYRFTYTYYSAKDPSEQYLELNFTDKDY